MGAKKMLAPQLSCTTGVLTLLRNSEVLADHWKLEDHGVDATSALTAIKEDGFLRKGGEFASFWSKGGTFSDGKSTARGGMLRDSSSENCLCMWTIQPSKILGAGRIVRMRKAVTDSKKVTERAVAGGYASDKYK